MLKEGWNEVPHLYGSLTIGAVALIAYVYRVAHTPPGGYITRFKERYMGKTHLIDTLMTSDAFIVTSDETGRPAIDRIPQRVCDGQTSPQRLSSFNVWI